MNKLIDMALQKTALMDGKAYRYQTTIHFLLQLLEQVGEREQLLQPFAAVRSSRTELLSVLYTRAPKDCLLRATISESSSKI